jgi:hypothetical protein
MGTRRRGALLLVAALCLLSLGSALYQESFAHTDDGCEVETHCLACRLVVASATHAALASPLLLPPQVPRNDAVRETGRRTLYRAVRPVHPRGPPTA